MRELNYIKSWTVEQFKTKESCTSIEVLEGKNGLWFKAGATTGTVSNNVTPSSKVKVSLCEGEEGRFYMLHVDKSLAPKFSF